MISHQELRKRATELELGVDIVEKDYVLGWMLYGVANSSISDKIIFKGGTALSKAYFAGQWRLSEDLDFTLAENTGWEKFVLALDKEIPDIVKKDSQITITPRDLPHTNPRYLQSKFKYAGPVSKATVKIEISREEEIGKFVTMQMPQQYDYPKFSVKVYTIETILAEKLRAILQRGKIRDYYDVWRLLKEKKSKMNVKELFLKKCKSKEIEFVSIEQFFPDGIENTLKKHLPHLTRLTHEPVTIDKILSETRKMIKDVI